LKGNPEFLGLPKHFWANVRSIDLRRFFRPLPSLPRLPSAAEEDPDGVHRHLVPSRLRCLYNDPVGRRARLTRGRNRPVWDA